MKYIKITITIVLTMSILLLSTISTLAKETNNTTIDRIASRGEEVTSRVLIKNDDVVAHNYKFSLNSIPKGFIGNFTLNDKVIDKFSLKGGESRVIALKIKVPQTALPGSNIFNAYVKRDDAKISVLPLSITTNNEYALAITNSVNGLSVINGQSLSFDVTVSNTGSKSLNNTTLALDMPYKWMIQSITPLNMVLKPNESGVFKIKIMVPSTQVTGNFKINAVASASASATATASASTVTAAGKMASPVTVIPVIVQSNPNFIYWVIGLLIISCIGTIIYFRKHGRR